MTVNKSPKRVRNIACPLHCWSLRRACREKYMIVSRPGIQLAGQGE
jgi:hypothetical protein